MNRERKAEVIDVLKQDFSQHQASFLVGVQGLTVSQMQALRKELRAKGGFLRVAKARLMKRAIDGMSGVEALAPYLRDQVGLIFVSDKIADIAKILTDFSKEYQALKLVAGCVEETVVPREKIGVIAALPSREVLLAQVCGTIKAPISNFAAVLNMQVIRLLWTLKQVEQKKQ